MLTSHSYICSQPGDNVNSSSRPKLIIRQDRLTGRITSIGEADPVASGSAEGAPSAIGTAPDSTTDEPTTAGSTIGRTFLPEGLSDCQLSLANEAGSDLPWRTADGQPCDGPTPFLLELERVLEERKLSTAERSYTRSLFEKGAPKIGAKLQEEAEELARALAGETDDRVANEAADLLYHLLVGLRFRNVELREVVRILFGRFGTSGHVEKASRKSEA